METSANKLPEKCLECAKEKKPRFHGTCDFCHDLKFQESVLCDLNRCIQDRTNFQCHAFEPALKLIKPTEENIKNPPDAPSKPTGDESRKSLCNSDKIKYERALALQKLDRDPGGVYVLLKYHFAWNVSLRKPVFRPAGIFFEFVSNVLLECTEMVGGYVSLLYLAPDHIHVYMESDGELSVEEMVNKIKRFLNDAILEKFTSVRNILGSDFGIWDEAYFVETVG
jgi:REP element-mobilizing transposase RayT